MRMRSAWMGAAGCAARRVSGIAHAHAQCAGTSPGGAGQWIPLNTDDSFTTRIDTCTGRTCVKFQMLWTQPHESCPPFSCDRR